MLRRIGNKQQIAHSIIRHFPKHSVYYEPFFGAGGLFFQKPLAKYNWLNDLDKEVFNFWTVVKDKKEELRDLLKLMPLHEEIFNHWKTHIPMDKPVERALRFLILSNTSCLWKGATMRLCHSNICHKLELEELIDPISDKLQRSFLRSKDFREFFKDIREGESHIPARKRFIYNDPPYINSTDGYNTPKWSFQDLEDLFEVSDNTSIPYAISEFDTPEIRDLAKFYNCQVIEIGERRTIESRNMEVLIVNYAFPKYRQTNIFEKEFV